MSKGSLGFLTVLVLVSMVLVPAVASAQDALPEQDGPPEIVQNGEYDVIVLGEDLGPGIRDHVSALLAKEYGDAVQYWTVKEAYGVNYVYAYPYTGDAKTAAFRDLLTEQITTYPAQELQPPASESPSIPTVTTCNRLHKDIFWLGQVFDTCGSQGTSRDFPNLASYSFDNMASSYYESNTSCGVSIYDGYNLTSHIGDVISDWAWFSSAYNDKASSINASY